jgi:dTDP-4-amino-4,6-dideoxygalactose transaminase
MTNGALRQRLASITVTQAADWFPVFKARYGMLAAFEAIAATRPERRAVVTQTLTCSTAVDPIIVAGLTPIYAEVSPVTFSIDPAALTLPDAAAALVIQHTFGVVAEADAGLLAEAAAAGGAVVVEDSAHCVTRMTRDSGGAPLADVSIHSFGVEKMLPTKFGGAVWVNPVFGSDTAADRETRAAIVAALSALPSPGVRLGLAARSYRVTRAALSRVPGGASVGRALTRAKLFSPAVSQAEREGKLEHEPVAASDWVAGQAATALADLPRVEARRLAAANAYAEALGAGPADQPLVRFPVLVPAGVDADAVLARLREQGIYAGAWYRPTLFPGASDPAVYGYAPGTLPVTEDVVARIVNLPTDVTVERAREIAAAYLELAR